MIVCIIVVEMTTTQALVLGITLIQSRHHCLRMLKFLLLACSSLVALSALPSPTFGMQRGSRLNVSPPDALGSKTRHLSFDAPTHRYSQVGQTLHVFSYSNGTIAGASGLDFGSSIALSSDGRRLVVVTSKVDLLPSEESANEASNNRKATVVYDIDGGVWVQKNHLFGASNELMSRSSIALSADGSILAISRIHPTRAEVYSIDTVTGEMIQLGGSIACEIGNNGVVALTETADGVIRLALACANDGDGGSARVLDWNPTVGTWDHFGTSPLALIDASSTKGGTFGFDLSWAKDGTRLAISAPTYNSRNLDVNGAGLVRVMDFDGTSTWTGVDFNIVGTDDSGNLGITIDISNDGGTLVIGSPNKNANGLDNAGVVSIYSLNTTDSTWILTEEFFGEAAGAGFGRHIQVNSDGSMVVAASLSQVRVFSLWNDSPVKQVANFQAVSDEKIMAVAMTGSGNRLAIGTYGADGSADGSGLVRVFEDRGTHLRSLTTSFAPSASPTENTDDLVGGGREIGKFEWDIEPKPELTTFTFSQQDSEMSEIQLHYNISLRNTAMQAFEKDCLTPIPSTVATLTSQLTRNSVTTGDFVVDVNIHQDNVTASSIWSDLDVGKGLISMCIRVDLTLPAPSYTSVHFHEQKLFVSVGLLQGFEITGIETDRLNATNSTGSADFDYNITACQCNADGDCANDVLSQGNEVYLCIETAAPNLEIEDVRELIVRQGDFNTTPIVGGVQDALTEVTIESKKAMIRYQIVSAFFLEADPEDLIAFGSILLTFAGDNGRRRFLRTSRVEFVPPRGSQEQEQEEGRWSIRMAVESAVPENHCSNGHSLTSRMWFGSLGYVVLVAWWGVLWL